MGPQPACRSPATPRISSRMSSGSRWLWAVALRPRGEKGALCLLEEELGVAAGHLASSHPEPARE